MANVTSHPTNTNQSELDVVAEEFAARYRRGERPAISEYTSRYPELAEEIEDLFPALAMIEQVDDDLRHVEEQTPAAKPVPPIKQLGDFRIIREVGQGGMGVVYEAEQVSLGRRVALKLLPQQRLAGQKQRKRFEREAKAAARLHHTNIVPVFGVGEQDGLHYYVMQFIDGLGLDDVIAELRQLREQQAAGPGTTQPQTPASEQRERKTAAAPVSAVAHSLLSGQFDRTVLLTDKSDSSDAEGNRVSDTLNSQLSTLNTQDTAVGQLSDTATGHFALPGSVTESHDTSQKVYWESVARIGVQAAQGLQYAHDQGIIHRDVKPANLLLDTRGCVWITDFGLAKADDQENLTHTGDVLGTLRYMAPEQFDGQADARSDLYSLGLTLYEMLSLQPGFRETDRHKLIKLVTTGTPPRLRTLDPHIPRDLETIIHKAIDRDPSHRYTTAGELAADLQRYLGDEPIRARWVSPITRFHRWCRRNPLVACLSTALVLFLATATAISIFAALEFRELAARNADLVDDKTELANDLQDALDDAEANLTLARQQEKQATANLALATTEQERAEGNLDLALAALDAVYLDAIGEEKLLGDPISRPQPDDEDFSPSARTPLTDLEKELLKRGLRFYDQFAQQNAATPQAALQTAQAHYRVGLLQAALGDHSAAESAYQSAVERFEQLTKQDPKNVGYHRQLADAYGGLAAAAIQWEQAKDATESAINACSNAIDLDPDNERLFESRSRYHLRLSKFDQAHADIERALELAPRDLALLHSAIWVYRESLTKRKGERIRELLNRVVEIDPDNLQAQMKLGLEARESGNFQTALEHFDRAVELAPGNANYVYWRAITRANLGDKKGARIDLELADKTGQGDESLAYSRARAYHFLGDYEEALKAYAVAQDRSPTNRLVFLHRGELHLQNSQYQKAIEDFTVDITMTLDSWAAIKKRGVAYFFVSEYEKALDDLRKARELRPQDLSTLIWMGAKNVAACPDAEFKQGLLKLADEAVAHPESNKALAHRYRAELLAAMERPEAVDDYTWLIENQPDQPAWRLRRGRLRRDAGDDVGAEADFDAYIAHHDEAIAQDETDWQAWNRRGVALANVGRWEAGLNDFAKAAEIAPDKPLPHKNRKAVCLGHARWEDAAKALGRLVELDVAGWRDEYELALLSLSTDQQSRYRDGCRRMIAAGSETNDAIEANFIAWTVALAPEAVEEYDTPLALAGKALESAADNHQYLNSLGALLYRTGRYDEAQEQLTALAEQLEEQDAQASSSPAYCWYFLAMTHHVLEETGEAQRWLTKANDWTVTVLADEARPPAWNRRLTLELLRDEATTLIGATNETSEPPPDENTSPPPPPLPQLDREERTEP